MGAKYTAILQKFKKISQNKLDFGSKREFILWDLFGFFEFFCCNMADIAMTIYICENQLKYFEKPRESGDTIEPGTFCEKL